MGRALCGLTVVLLAACGSAGGGSMSGGGTVAPSTPSSGPSAQSSGASASGPSSSSGGIHVSLACRGVVLSATVTTSTARAAQLRLTNTGTSPCTVFGYADVRPAGPDGAAISVAPRASRVPRPSAPTKVTLAPGGHAYAGLLIEASGACASGSGAAVTPPVDGTPIPARVVSADGAATKLSACRFVVGPLRATAAAAHL